MSKLEKIKITVELNTGETHDIVVTNPSLVAFDRTRVTRKWPSAEDGPTLWLTFISWHHLKAAGVLNCTFDEYESKICVQVGDTPAEKDENGADVADDAVDPIQPAPAPDFVSSLE